MPALIGVHSHLGQFASSRMSADGEQLCRLFRRAGITHGVAFSIARQDELMTPVPDGVSAEEASPAYLPQLGVAAMRKAGYQAGENVAVIGLGVIGLRTVAIARAMGAKVAAIANSPLRLARGHSKALTAAVFDWRGVAGET